MTFEKHDDKGLRLGKQGVYYDLEKKNNNNNRLFKLRRALLTEPTS